MQFEKIKDVYLHAIFAVFTNLFCITKNLTRLAENQFIHEKCQFLVERFRSRNHFVICCFNIKKKLTNWVEAIESHSPIRNIARVLHDKIRNIFRFVIERVLIAKTKMQCGYHTVFCVSFFVNTTRTIWNWSREHQTSVLNFLLWVNSNFKLILLLFDIRPVPKALNGRNWIAFVSTSKKNVSVYFSLEMFGNQMLDCNPDPDNSLVDGQGHSLSFLSGNSKHVWVD